MALQNRKNVPLTFGAPMPKNIKPEIAAYLRKKNIPYETYPSILFFNQVSVFFDVDNEYLIIRSPFKSDWSYSTPFCSPETLLRKIARFKLAVTGTRVPLRVELLTNKNKDYVKFDSPANIASRCHV